MAVKSQTKMKAPTKAEIVAENAELKARLDELSKKVDEKKEPKKDDGLSDQLKHLISENNKLREQLKKSRDSEKFVGIKSLSKGTVWLPSPESESGNFADRQKGRMLKPNQSTIIPASWAVWLIETDNLAFRMGDLMFDNDSARKISPNVEFADLDVPKHFLTNVLTSQHIHKQFITSAEKGYQLIEKYKSTRFILERIYGVVVDLEQKSSGAARAKYSSIVADIEAILYPDESQQ